MTPLLSIICITYNQDKFVGKTLEGFLMQKTNFPIEIIIHDDASTDNTKEILIDFKKKNYEMVSLLLEKENKFSKNNYKFVEQMFRMAKGKYIALCEGDDYWTEANKLQTQVDFLEKHEDYSISFHPVKVIFEDNKNKSYVFPDPEEQQPYNLKELLKSNYIQTNSVVYRKQHYTNFNPNTLPIDYYLHLYHAQFGKIGHINKVMSVYRIHKNGVWYDGYNNPSSFWEKNWETNLLFYNKIANMYHNNVEYQNIISESISNVYRKLAEVDKKKKMLNKAIIKYPENATTTINVLLLQLHDCKSLFDRMNIEHQNIIETINKKNDELNSIKSSKFWKLRNLYSKIIGRGTIE